MKEGMLTRYELADAVGMHAATFYRKLLEVNAIRAKEGLPGLEPDFKEPNGKNRPKFFYKAERVEEFKQAIATRGFRYRGKR